MDFKEFYKLLEEALTKEVSYIEPNKDNFNVFLMNRYLSFYHPEIAIHISKTTNRLGFIPDCGDEYHCIKSILPKLPNKFIEYIKKPSVIATQKLNFTDEEIYIEAKLNECSKREIRNMILNYEKRS